MALPTSDNTVNVTRLGSILSTLWDKIKTALGNKANKTDLAPTYSASSTYAVGDTVIYSNTLYRCTTAITTAEAWTSAHWTTTDVGNELDRIEPLVCTINEEQSGYVCDQTILDIAAAYNAGKPILMRYIVPGYGIQGNLALSVFFDYGEEPTTHVHGYVMKFQVCEDSESMLFIGRNISDTSQIIPDEWTMDEIYSNAHTHGDINSDGSSITYSTDTTRYLRADGNWAVPPGDSTGDSIILNISDYFAYDSNRDTWLCTAVPPLVDLILTQHKNVIFRGDLYGYGEIYYFTFSKHQYTSNDRHWFRFSAMYLDGHPAIADMEILITNVSPVTTSDVYIYVDDVNYLANYNHNHGNIRNDGKYSSDPTNTYKFLRADGTYTIPAVRVQCGSANYRLICRLSASSGDPRYAGAVFSVLGRDNQDINKAGFLYIKKGRWTSDGSAKNTSFSRFVCMAYTYPANNVGLQFYQVSSADDEIQVWVKNNTTTIYTITLIDAGGLEFSPDYTTEVSALPSNYTTIPQYMPAYRDISSQFNAAVGASDIPVYVNSNGVVQSCGITKQSYFHKYKAMFDNTQSSTTHHDLNNVLYDNQLGQYEVVVFCNASNYSKYHAPASGWWQVEVEYHPGNDSYCTQLARGYTGDIYFRGKSNGTWSTWKKLN